MVLAHLGHWYAEILYVLPVGLVAGFLAISTHREKRRARRAADGSAGSSAEPRDAASGSAA